MFPFFLFAKGIKLANRSKQGNNKPKSTYIHSKIALIDNKSLFVRVLTKKNLKNKKKIYISCLQEEIKSYSTLQTFTASDKINTCCFIIKNLESYHLSIHHPGLRT